MKHLVKMAPLIGREDNGFWLTDCVAHTLFGLQGHKINGYGPDGAVLEWLKNFQQDAEHQRTTIKLLSSRDWDIPDTAKYCKEHAGALNKNGDDDVIYS